MHHQNYLDDSFPLVSTIVKAVPGDPTGQPFFSFVTCKYRETKKVKALTLAFPEISDRQ